MASEGWRTLKFATSFVGTARGSRDQAATSRSSTQVASAETASSEAGNFGWTEAAHDPSPLAVQSSPRETILEMQQRYEHEDNGLSKVNSIDWRISAKAEMDRVVSSQPERVSLSSSGIIPATDIVSADAPLLSALPPPSPHTRWKSTVQSVTADVSKQLAAEADIRKKAGIEQTRSKYELKFETLSRLSLE